MLTWVCKKDNRSAAGAPVGDSRRLWRRFSSENLGLRRRSSLFGVLETPHPPAHCHWHTPLLLRLRDGWGDSYPSSAACSEPVFLMETPTVKNFYWPGKRGGI